MKNKLKRILIIFMTAFTVSSTCATTLSVGIVSEAHSGRTDSNGGHKDNKNKSGLGPYHYHCGGNPAHLHTDGVCPYANTSKSVDNTSSKTEKTEISSNTSTTATTTAASVDQAVSSEVTSSVQQLVSSDYDNLIFSAQYYVTKYPDLATSIGYNSQDLYNHFIQYGIAEGRQGIESFNVQVYRDNNPDLAAAFGDDLMSYYNHYIQTGHNEGRICY